jgi:hypothetical protein
VLQPQLAVVAVVGGTQHQQLAVQVVAEDYLAVQQEQQGKDSLEVMALIVVQQVLAAEVAVQVRLDQTLQQILVVLVGLAFHLQLLEVL